MLSNHIYLITYVTGGVAASWWCSFNILIGPEEGRSLATRQCLKDPHFQSSVDWLLEAHRKPTNNSTKTT